MLTGRLNEGGVSVDVVVKAATDPVQHAPPIQYYRADHPGWPGLKHELALYELVNAPNLVQSLTNFRVI
jgi:hypothetical protein